MPLSTSAYVVPLSHAHTGLEDWPSANGFTQAASHSVPGRSADLSDAEKAALSRAAASLSASLLNNV